MSANPVDLSRIPIDLSGTWLDGRRKAVITQEGTSVIAKYVEPYECKYADDLTMTTNDDFTATLSEEERLLTGQTTVCEYSTGSRPPGRGIVWSPMKLRVSADGEHLDGKCCIKGAPEPMGLRALYSKVELRLMAFIPSPAIRIPTGLKALSDVLIFGGDDRGYDYDSGRYRAFQSVVVTVDPEVDIPTRYGPIRDYGPSTIYYLRQVEQDDDRGWWCRIKPGEHPWHTETARVTDWNSRIQVDRAGANSVRVTFHLWSQVAAPGLPLKLAPRITANIVATVTQEEGKPAKVGLEGRHDGFPAYEIYANGKWLHRHDPLVTSETPLSTGLWAEWPVSKPPTEVPGLPVRGQDKGDVGSLDCPPWTEQDEGGGFLEP